MRCTAVPLPLDMVCAALAYRWLSSPLPPHPSSQTLQADSLDEVQAQLASRGIPFVRQEVVEGGLHVSQLFFHGARVCCAAPRRRCCCCCPWHRCCKLHTRC